MVDERQVIEDLGRYAKGIAHKLLVQKGLSHDEHRLEDVAQSLLLAGESRQLEGFARLLSQ